MNYGKRQLLNLVDEGIVRAKQCFLTLRSYLPWITHSVFFAASSGLFCNWNQLGVCSWFEMLDFDPLMVEWGLVFDPGRTTGLQHSTIVLWNSKEISKWICCRCFIWIPIENVNSNRFEKYWRIPMDNRAHIWALIWKAVKKLFVSCYQRSCWSNR